MPHAASQLMTSQWKPTTTAINQDSQNATVDTCWHTDFCTDCWPLISSELWSWPTMWKVSWFKRQSRNRQTDMTDCIIFCTNLVGNKTGQSYAMRHLLAHWKLQEISDTSQSYSLCGRNLLSFRKEAEFLKTQLCCLQLGSLLVITGDARLVLNVVHYHLHAIT